MKFSKGKAVIFYTYSSSIFSLKTNSPWIENFTLRPGFVTYSDVEVRREWKNIDVLVIIDEDHQNVVFSIENKIKSPERRDQLQRYSAAINNQFKEYLTIKKIAL